MPRPDLTISPVPDVGEARIAIRNRAALISHGLVALRADVLAIAEAGLRACDPRPAVSAAVALDGSALVVEGVRHELGARGRIRVLGAGKASLSIAEALLEVAGPRIAGGMVAVPPGSSAERVDGALEVVVSGHPLPTSESEAAARRLLELAAGARPEDLLVACFTGGSSALASLPPAGVSLAEKRELHRALLAAGMPIVDVNTVRKHVSAIKGGRLTAAAPAGRVVNLTVSDVAGDHLDAITDPTVSDSTTPQDAIAILRAYDIWDDVAPAIRAHLTGPQATSPALTGPVQTVVLVTGAEPCDAMAKAARYRGYTPVVLSHRLEGEAREIGALLATLAVESELRGEPFARPCALLGCGGETTVTLHGRGDFGAGGPNREAALAAALALPAGCRVAGVFVDTDGADGSPTVAGAIADGTTVQRARAAGLDLRAALLAHRSGAAVDALQDAITTGLTGTNVNDLFAIVIGAAP